jgi:hypothetical protein
MWLHQADIKELSKDLNKTETDLTGVQQELKCTGFQQVRQGN